MRRIKIGITNLDYPSDGYAVYWASRRSMFYVGKAICIWDDINNSRKFIGQIISVSIHAWDTEKVGTPRHVVPQMTKF